MNTIDVPSRKIKFIQEYLQLEDEQTMFQLGNLLYSKTSTMTNKRSFRDFVGIISQEDAKEMIDAIEDGCEKIDNENW